MPVETSESFVVNTEFVGSNHGLPLIEADDFFMSITAFVFGIAIIVVSIGTKDETLLVAQFVIGLALALVGAGYLTIKTQHAHRRRQSM